MVFIQGTYDIPTITSLIVNALKSTDDFTEYDVDALIPSASNTNQTGPTMGEYIPGYCLKHNPTGVYLSIGASPMNFTQSNNVPSYWRYNGMPCIAVIFSTEWNLAEHKAAGTIYTGLIPYYSYSANLADGLAHGVTPYEFSTALYVDKCGFQMVVNNTYSGGISFFATCEFFPLSWMEYDDTRKPIVFYVKRAADGHNSYPMDLNNLTTGALYIRPFGLHALTYASMGNNVGAHLSHTRQAYRSPANNKVYFEFPYYQNENTIFVQPIAHTRRWFPVDKTNGSFNLQDIVNWIDPDGVTVHKYIIVALTADQYWAIPYENGFDYTVSEKF